MTASQVWRNLAAAAAITTAIIECETFISRQFTLTFTHIHAMCSLCLTPKKLHNFLFYFVNVQQSICLQTNSIDRFQSIPELCGKQRFWWIPYKRRPMQQFQQFRKSCNVRFSCFFSRHYRKISLFWPHFQNGFQNGIVILFQHITQKKHITAFNARPIINKSGIRLDLIWISELNGHFVRLWRWRAMDYETYQRYKNIDIDIYPFGMK